MRSREWVRAAGALLVYSFPFSPGAQGGKEAEQEVLLSISERPLSGRRRGDQVPRPLEPGAALFPTPNRVTPARLWKEGLGRSERVGCGGLRCQLPAPTRPGSPLRYGINRFPGMAGGWLENGLPGRVFGEVEVRQIRNGSRFRRRVIGVDFSRLFC